MCSLRWSSRFQVAYVIEATWKIWLPEWYSRAAKKTAIITETEGWAQNGAIVIHYPTIPVSLGGTKISGFLLHPIVWPYVLHEIIALSIYAPKATWKFSGSLPSYKYSELTKTSTALARLTVTCVLSAAHRLILIFVNPLYFPKQIDFRNIDDREIRRVQDELNRRPRKTLGCETPSVLFLNLFQALVSECCTWNLHASKSACRPPQNFSHMAATNTTLP